jgi:hypothetical protein
MQRLLWRRGLCRSGRIGKGETRRENLISIIVIKQKRQSFPAGENSENNSNISPSSLGSYEGYSLSKSRVCFDSEKERGRGSELEEEGHLESEE